MTSLPMLTTRQWCLFLCDVFFRSMGQRYVMCTFVANQHHNCRSSQVFEWLHRKTELVILHHYMHGRSGCHDWMTFWFHYPSQRGCFWMQAYALSSTEKCWLAKKCHLNLTMFCRMWLKWSTTLKHMPVTRVYSCSSVTRWRQSTHVFSCTQERDGYRKGDHWPEFLSYRATPEISFRKTVTTGSTFQWHTMCHRTCLLVWHSQPAQQTQSVTSGENNCVQIGR